MTSKRIFLKIFIPFLLAFSSINANNKADLIIFSYNRPTQLYALLESAKYYIDGIDQTHVIYRSSNHEYEKAYKEVKLEFPEVIFHKQGKNPQKNFKSLTIKTIVESPSNYVMFGVDDIIVKDFIDIKLTTKLLYKTQAYGFFLRLGLHIDHNYPRNKPEKVPQCKPITQDVFTWKFTDGTGYWGYPNTVDMTIYRKEEVIDDFKDMKFTNPNTLESRWNCKRGKLMKKEGLCFKTAKIVNFPLNRVQTGFNNRYTKSLTAKELLEIFNQGLKIDIAPIHKIVNKSAHMDYEPTFIER